MKTRDAIKALEADGWQRVPSKGGHLQLKHPTKPARVTVPFHGGNAELRPDTLRAIERQAGLRLGRK